MNPFDFYTQRTDLKKHNEALQEYQNGLYYYSGCPEQHIVLALDFFESAAEKGLADAQFALACCYHRGEGVVQNNKKAFFYYQLAASQGQADALLSLGYCYHFGKGVTQDHKAAFENYSLVAKNYSLAAKGSLVASPRAYSSALSNLGTCYYNGIGVEPDPKKAFEYFELAANHGNIAAYHNLGSCYIMGEGIERDIKYALELYFLAYVKGEEDSRKSISAYYIQEHNRDHGNGFYLTRADILNKMDFPDEAEDAYKRYLNYQPKHENDFTRQAMLGFLYQFGIGTKRDPKKAVELYKEAHKLDIPKPSLYHMDIFLCNKELFTSGQLSKKELLETYSDLKTQAESNSEAAQFVGYLYERVAPELDQNLYTAFDYYSKAKNLNSNDHYSQRKVKKYQELLDSNDKLFNLFETEIFTKEEPHLPNGVVRIISEYALKR